MIFTLIDNKVTYGTIHLGFFINLESFSYCR
jgi:hypothetical protein